MFKVVLKVVFIFLSFKAVSQNEEVLKQQLKTAQSDVKRIEILFKIADSYNSSIKNTDSLFFYLDTLEKDFTLKKGSANLARFNKLKASAYHLKANHVKAIEYGKEALSYYKGQNNIRESALIKSKIGAAYQGLHRGKDALLFFKEAERDLLGDDLILVYLGLGNTYAQLNDLENAIYYFTKTKVQAEKSKNPGAIMSMVYNGMAYVYSGNNDTEKAAFYFQKSADLAKKNKSYLGQVLALHNIGWIYLEANKTEEAINIYKKAYNLIDKVDYIALKGITTFGYGKALMLTGNLEKASLLVNEAHTLYKSIGNKNRIPHIYNVKAAIAYKKGNTSNAILLLQEALELSKNNEMADIAKDNYADLSAIYNDLGKHEESLIAYKKYETIKDSIRNRKKIKEIETLKIQFEVGEMEKDLEFKNQKLTALEFEKKASNYRNILLATVGIGLLFFIFRQRKINSINQKQLQVENELIKIKEEQLQTEMTHKNNEITEYAVHINERNKLLNTFSKKLKTLKSISTEGEVKNIAQKIQFFIDDNIVINKEKVELNTKIERTEESFIYSLKTKHPKLTAKELKVATFLILDLPSKTIANQMGINQQSVNNYRFSIRKKIGLTKEDNLIDFLRNIT